MKTLKIIAALALTLVASCNTKNHSMTTDTQPQGPAGKSDTANLQTHSGNEIPANGSAGVASAAGNMEGAQSASATGSVSPAASPVTTSTPSTHH